MKKKRSQLQISKIKTILLVAIIVAAGIFILAISVLFAPLNEKSHKEPTEQSSVQDNDTKNKIPKNEGQKAPSKPQQTPDRQESPLDKTLPPEPPILAPTQHPENVTPQKNKTGNLIFVFDDAGNNLEQLQSFVDLPFPVTISVMPQCLYSSESARRIRASDKEVFLHQPMQALNQNINPGAGAILPTMDGAQITAQLKANIAQIAPIKGMNNHEGSLITSDRYRMGVVLDVCIDENLIFLDSRTNSNSIVAYSAMDRELQILTRDIFIDNSAKRSDMKDMIEKGLAVADKQGYAVMIGHVFNPELATLLDDMYPILKMQGYTFITASELYAHLYK
jgi:polysaccharide deacetylase 2 family uncharacterized protein YibQ